MPPKLVSFTPPAGAAHLRARADAILWIKSAIARHGITLQQLEFAGCFAFTDGAPPAQIKKYMDASGHAWDGIGSIPDWLQRAINSGQTVEHFRVV